MSALSPQLPLNVTLDIEARFDTFFVGPNADAIAALQRLPQPGVWLTGEGQSGRSHLLQSVVAAESDRPALYLPLEQSLPPEAIQGLPAHAVVCLDDVDSVAGDETWERALMMLWEQANRGEGRLVVSALDVPAATAFGLKDLTSRMSALTTFRLRSPDEEGQMAALQRRADARGLTLSDDAAKYLLHRLPRSLAVLFEWLGVLDQHALGAARNLTLPFVRGVVRAAEGDLEIARSTLPNAHRR